MARFVLVHGAFHGAWCWEGVTGELEARGHTVEVFDLPGLGDDQTPAAEVTLDAYADRIRDVLGSSDERAVLVGHSMGGVAITQAAARCPERIASLVYVCAFLPADGQSLVDLTQLPEGAGDGVQANAIVEGEPPVSTMPRDKAIEVFYAACEPEVAERAASRIRPQPIAPFVTPVSAPADGEFARLSRSYVVCTQDRAIPAALQRRMAGERANGEVVELDADHSPFLSRRDELVELLDRFAAAAT
jgi:pimeloyl-ACP methyl ester carboxylesterase